MFIFLGILFLLMIIGTCKVEWEKQQANRAMIEMNKRQKRQEEQQKGGDQQ